jgi:nucleoid-associated protein YgaU
MDTYKKAKIFSFSEGDFNLVRTPYHHIPSSEDKVYQVIEGDRLDTLAFKFYNNSRLWYILADTNNIINPFELEIGQSLIIPHLR